MAFQLPESLDGLSASDIQALINAALDDFNALGPLTEDSDDATLDAAEVLSTAIVSLQEGLVAAEAAADERRQRVERLNQTVATDAPDDPTEEGDEGEGDEGDEDETPEVIVPDEVLEPVAASATRPTRSPVRRAAAAAPAVVIPQRRTATLLAAADVPGYANGQELDDLSLVASAILARTRGLPTTNLATAAGGVRQRYGAALVHKSYDDEALVQTKAAGDDMALLAAAGNQSRLQGGSLTAAGGWCAPSETFYDLCQYETVEGILDIPDMNVTRGGIRWTQGPSFDDIYEACGFEQTEAEAQAGECKDCCTVECPPFEEIRLDAIGLCVKSPILTETAYPELVRRFTEGALVAHQHKVNKYIIDTMVAAAGPPITAPATGESISITLSFLALQALGMRYAYRLALNADIEVVAPFWLKASLREDHALRNITAYRRVSDAELDGWFSDRHLRVQWVYDYQDPTVAGCEVTLPANATVLMYPSGTWVKGSADVISLDAVYDSPNLEANQYTALFVEEGILAVQRCTHTCAITLPVCVSGKGTLEDIDLCLAAI
jgi:hypothetical protein